MPVPKWIAKVNKRVFNPREIRKGKRPVLIHTGRASGKTFYTPLDAHRVDDGYVFIVMYGADKSDWVKNILELSTCLSAQDEPSRDDTMAEGADELKKRFGL